MLIGDNGYNYADALQQFFVATGRYPDPSEYPAIEHAWDTMSWASYSQWAADNFKNTLANSPSSSSSVSPLAVLAIVGAALIFG